MSDATIRQHLDFAARKARHLAERAEDLARRLMLPDGHAARPSAATIAAEIDRLHSIATFEAAPRLRAARGELESGKANGAAEPAPGPLVA